MDSWLKVVLIGAAVSAGMAVFAKLVPKDKLLGWVKPSAVAAGRVVNALLYRVFGASAEAVEEGVICTVVFAAKGWLDAFEAAILADNRPRTGPRTTAASTTATPPPTDQDAGDTAEIDNAKG